MKFRTEIEIAPLARRIGYRDRLLSLGSCFAERIAGRMAAAKFRIITNPTGVLFNPFSVAGTLEQLLDPAPVRREELHHDGALWFHYDFHGSFSGPEADRVLAGMQAARRAGAEALATADWLLLTFGTARVYEHEGRVVANCHRQPAADFVRRQLTAAEVVERCAALFEGPLAAKQIVLTVSPVRHLGDGLSGNALSKAVLRVAAAELEARCPNVHYFPSFEILTDDLRDYRFYGDDLVHPSEQAVDYIWEKFAAAALDDEAQRLLPEVEAIRAAALHRPRYPHGAAHADFCRRMLARIEALPGIDFSDEAAVFRSSIEINS